MTLTDRCLALVEELQLGRADEVSDIEPLPGGVASDIVSLRIGDRRLCAKFALEKLRVAEDWRAPVHRNAAEYAWLEFAATVAPNNAVRTLGRSPSLGGFAMEFISGPNVTLWKTMLLGGQVKRGAAAAVGDLVGTIHAASTQPGFQRVAFANRDDFSALRLDPYLRFTARRHPEASDALLSLAAMLYESESVLVHGDVSPKNILLRGNQPLILDAECATMGDACFDPAFCINHLILKAIHVNRAREALLGEAIAFWTSYAAHVAWEDQAALEKRLCQLLPALMLARVDGKSPVEYLSFEEQSQVRTLALNAIKAPHGTLADFITATGSTL